MKHPTIAELSREIREHRALISRLSKALYMHARTDLAPDSCLPSLRRLIDKIDRKRNP